MALHCIAAGLKIAGVVWAWLRGTMTVVLFLSAVGLFVITSSQTISANVCQMLLFCCLNLIFVHYCVCRKYDQALEYHRQALVLIPQHASTYAAIGYVHSLMGDFESAIDYFHTVKCRLFWLVLICFPGCMCMRAVSFRTETTSF